MARVSDGACHHTIPKISLCSDSLVTVMELGFSSGRARLRVLVTLAADDSGTNELMQISWF